MTNKKNRRSKTFFILDIFEDLYFPEILCVVIVSKRQNQVCNLYLRLDNVTPPARTEFKIHKKYPSLVVSFF